jgi:hypothetical protein
VGPPCRLWQPITTAAVKNIVDSRLQVYPVSYRDVHGLDLTTASHHRPDDLVSVAEVSVSASLRARLVVSAIKARFSTANRRSINDEANVSSQTHTAGMGQTLSIEDKEIRLCNQLFQGFQDYWSLSKSEEPRDIGERRGLFSRVLVNGGQIRIIEHDYSRFGYVVFHTDIDPGHGAHLGETGFLRHFV